MFDPVRLRLTVECSTVFDSVRSRSAVGGPPGAPPAGLHYGSKAAVTARGLRPVGWVHTELYRALPNTTEHGRPLPSRQVNLRTGRPRNSPGSQRSTPLAEFGTIQLEFLALSDATGDPNWGDLAEARCHVLDSVR